MSWVLRSINNRKVEETQDRFSKRFLEMFKLSDVTVLLEGLRDKVFDGGAVMMVQPDANARRDAITCVIGNDEAERYLSLFLTVDETTGQIAGLSFATGVGNDRGGENDSTDLFDGVGGSAGDIPRDVWFGLYRIGFSTEKSDLRIKEIYEFGHKRKLNIGTFSRIYPLLTASHAIVQAAGSNQDEQNSTNIATSPRNQLLASHTLATVTSAGAKLTLENTFVLALSGDQLAVDAITARFTRSAIEDTLRQFQDGADVSLPWLTFAAWRTLCGDAEKSAAYGESKQREPLGDLKEGDELSPQLREPLGWEEPRNIERVGWFANAREAAYALAQLAEYSRKAPEIKHMWDRAMQPELRERAKETELLPPVQQAPLFASDTYISARALAGPGVPGVCAIGYILEHKNGSTYVMVMAWNDSKNPLEEPRMYTVAKKGVAILEREIETTAP